MISHTITIGLIGGCAFNMVRLSQAPYTRSGKSLLLQFYTVKRTEKNLGLWATVTVSKNIVCPTKNATYTSCTPVLQQKNFCVTLSCYLQILLQVFFTVFCEFSRCDGFHALKPIQCQILRFWSLTRVQYFYTKDTPLRESALLSHQPIIIVYSLSLLFLNRLLLHLIAK